MAVSAPLQLGLEHSAMATLVRQKLLQFSHHARGKEPRHEQLAAVDTDRAMLTGMVDFDHAVAQIRVVHG
jgi:hypothetical protein